MPTHEALLAETHKLALETAQEVVEIRAALEVRKEVMRETITLAVQNAMPRALLSDEQYRWVELAIKRESQSFEFRRALIEKTFTAFIIFVLGAIGTGLWKLVSSYVEARGWK